MIEIYKASAGSGKTFTLAREYIKLILGTKDENGAYHLRGRGTSGLHKSVLAITFTNKATEEMKSRIIHELAVIAGAEKGWTKQSDYQTDLCTTFSCTPGQLSLAAQDALRELLYEFNQFNVSTIDSFFQTVLRSFAQEADVSGGYDVELDDKAVITVSVDQMLSDLNHARIPKDGAELIAWLTNFMTNLIDDGKTFNLFNRSSGVFSQLVEFIGNIRDDTFRENEDRIIAYLKDPERIKNFSEAIRNMSEAAAESIKSACEAALAEIGLHDPTDLKMRGILNSNVSGFLQKWGATGRSDRLGTTEVNVADNIDAAYTKGGLNSEYRMTLDALISTAAKSIIRGNSLMNFSKIIVKNLYHLGLLAHVVKYINLYRIENSTLLLSDTNTLLSKVIGKEDSPFLYEKIGTRYSHYLIDEFQDTSYSQWRNLQPLVRESLAFDHDSLVIGDEKQSIYRFRGSDSTLLQNLHKGQLADYSHVSGETIEENTNWRSAAEVVRFNNTLFTSLAKVMGYFDIYKGVAQQVAKKNEDLPGYVRLIRVTSDDYDTDVLDTLVEDVRRQLESGYRPGDIAVLVKKREQGAKVIQRLERAKAEDPDFPHFNIVSDSSMEVSSSVAVRLIVSRLRYLASLDFVTDRRRHSSKEVARVVNDFEIESVRKSDSTEALYAAVKSLTARQEAQSRGEQIPIKAPDEAMAEADIFSLVELIVKSIPKDVRDADAVFITAFQELTTEFVAKGKADVRSFLDWWDLKGSSTSVAGANDPTAINILTIHKSKGLEFPCVHVPYTSFDQNPRTDTDWFNMPKIPDVPDELIPPMMPLDIVKGMADTPLADEYAEVVRKRQIDNLNLLYVALTRASRELSVFINGKNGNGIEAAITQALTQLKPASIAVYEREKNLPTGMASPFVCLQFKDDFLELGQPTFPKPEEKKQRSAITPAEGDKITEYRVGKILSPWANTCVQSNRTPDMTRGYERGIVIHDIMSRIVRPADIAPVFDKISRNPDWAFLDAGELAAIREIVETRVNDRRVGEWFNGFERVLIEREALTSAGRTRRFDRVVWTASGEIHIVDYKTGRQPSKAYRREISEYKDFFRSIGHPDVKAYLYYLDTGDIIEM